MLVFQEFHHTRLQGILGTHNMEPLFPDQFLNDFRALSQTIHRSMDVFSNRRLNKTFQVFSLVGLVLYLVLVPISIFFFLKDKDQLLEWVGSLLPSNRPLLTSVGNEMNLQLGNYVRGKFIEILIVGAATFISFIVLGLNYAALLGVLVGLSVLIPFVGAALVTIPVFVVAVIQFGWTWTSGC